MKKVIFIFHTIILAGLLIIPSHGEANPLSSLAQGCKSVITNKYVLSATSLAATVAFLRSSPYDIHAIEHYLPFFTINTYAFPPTDLEEYMQETYTKEALEETIDVPRWGELEKQTVGFEELYSEMLRIKKLKVPFYQRIKNLFMSQPHTQNSEKHTFLIIVRDDCEYVQAPKKLLIQLRDSIETNGFISFGYCCYHPFLNGNREQATHFDNKASIFWYDDSVKYSQWKRNKQQKT